MENVCDECGEGGLRTDRCGAVGWWQRTSRRENRLVMNMTHILTNSLRANNSYQTLASLEVQETELVAQRREEIVHVRILVQTTSLTFWGGVDSYLGCFDKVEHSENEPQLMVEGYC